MNWHFHIRSLGHLAPSSFVKSANAVKLNARFADIGGKAFGLEGLASHCKAETTFTFHFSKYYCFTKHLTMTK